MNPLYSIKNDDPRVKQAVDHIVTLQENYPLTVTYDATRLRPAEVEAALTGAGIPILSVHRV